MPTNDFALSTDIIEFLVEMQSQKDFYPPPGSRIFPVPKSVIFIRIASSKSKFSGLRSLWPKLSACTRMRRVRYVPMDDTFGMHIFDGVKCLSSIISSTSGG